MEYARPEEDREAASDNLDDDVAGLLEGISGQQPKRLALALTRRVRRRCQRLAPCNISCTKKRLILHFLTRSFPVRWYVVVVMVVVNCNESIGLVAL